MLSTIKRVTIVGAAVAAASLGLISTTASALPPGSASSGAVTLTPPTGNSSTVMTILPPSPSFCPGDSATGGYRWQTFIVTGSADPATLTYDSSGPVAPAGATAFPLYTNFGSPVVAENTAVNTGQIVVADSYSFAVFPPAILPAGAYNFGYACTLNGVTMKFWSSQMTITTDVAAGGPAQLDYALVTGPPPDVPEVPFGVLLPASAIGLLGGAAMVARRRRMKATV